MIPFLWSEPGLLGFWGCVSVCIGWLWRGWTLLPTLSMWLKSQYKLCRSLPSIQIDTTPNIVTFARQNVKAFFFKLVGCRGSKVANRFPFASLTFAKTDVCWSFFSSPFRGIFSLWLGCRTTIYQLLLIGFWGHALCGGGWQDRWHYWFAQVRAPIFFSVGMEGWSLQLDDFFFRRFFGFVWKIHCRVPLKRLPLPLSFGRNHINMVQNILLYIYTHAYENELGRFVTLKMLSWEILQPLEWLQPHGL